MRRTHEKVERELEQIYALHRPSLGRGHPWESEQSRWHELAFCILSRIATTPPTTALPREAANALAHAGLLDVAKLASLRLPLNRSESRTAIMQQVLGEWGFSARQTSQGLTAIVGIAKRIQRDYGGAVQRFLRQSGERMVREAVESLPLDSMTAQDTEYIFRHWFQNALLLPISIGHPSLKAYCKQRKISIGDLIDVADRLHLNVAVLDDLMIMHGLGRSPRELASAKKSSGRGHVSARRDSRSVAQGRKGRR